ncbi:MAG: hypothetical protein RLZZ31_1604 [Actinomycetota bacterium]|jgi:para-nitrobenzyl esterase
MTSVVTPSGRILGRQIAGGAEFLGIRYAAAPDGLERFRAPRPATPTEEITATSYGQACWQPRGGPLDGLVPDMGSANQGDDCLNLNIWMPTNAENAPVLVWIHGGAFSLGANSLPVYNGARLATSTSSIVVGINYRLGVFGFLCHDGADANVGILDQIAALRWIQENISSFGGDANNVTIFGESAGGGSVLSLLSSPLARGLFQKAIVQSGATDLLLERDRAALVADEVFQQAGVASLEEFAELPGEKILAAQAAAAGALFATVGTMPFHPCIDGKVLPTSWLEAAQRGINPVPLIIGTTRNEMNLFRSFDPSAANLDDEGLKKRLSQHPHPDQVIAAYHELGIKSAPDIWQQFTTDTAMWRHAIAIAEAHSQHAPVWMYRFDWPAAAAELGAPHGVDIPFAFGTIEDGGWKEFVSNPQKAMSLSVEIQKAWSSFARQGAPQLSNQSWPSYNVESRSTALLADSITIENDPGQKIRQLLGA